MSESRAPVIDGGAVVLRPLSMNDVPLLTRWFSDPEVVRWLHLSEDPPELLTEAGVSERHQKLESDSSNLLWRIDTPEGQAVGQVELVKIQREHRRAEIHICIGEKRYWGHGLGTQAISSVLGHAFSTLKLRRVFTVVDADNTRMLACLRKCRFSREGVLRAHRLRHGEPVDMVLMGILSSELESPT